MKTKLVAGKLLVLFSSVGSFAVVQPEIATPEPESIAPAFIARRTNYT
jgi:hypothetical protein